MLKRSVALVLIIFVAPAFAYESTVPADTGRRCAANQTPHECGWYYNWNDPKRDKKKPEVITVGPQTKAPKEVLDEAKRCADPDTWSAECGFVDPGSNFQFQSIQRDALMERMVMHADNPSAVKEFQRYMRWAVTRAVEVSQMWEWNRVQDPSLNPNVTNPAGTYGLQMLTRAKTVDRENVMEMVRESGGFLVWFTRSTCSYCHDTLHIVRGVAEKTGLELFNASLDATCYPGFEGEYCVAGDASIDAAKRLAVLKVPDLFLYMPDTDTWIRLSTGVEDMETIVSRVSLFFKAVTAAAENGIHNAQGFSPSVNFEAEAVRSLSRGLGVGVDGNDPGSES